MNRLVVTHAMSVCRTAQSVKASACHIREDRELKR